ncbi:site-specific DNA-cytosine methylase [Corynebacterium mucifaciens]|uniref:Site-specific DNA-cytosine methylase n=1 Tax=Corynebacterium mucifaciens TaxID=57171 RepID=A0ABV2NXG4_9CORY
MAGFDHAALVEIEPWPVTTLRHNRPEWNIIQADLNEWEPDESLYGLDLSQQNGPWEIFIGSTGKQAL